MIPPSFLQDLLARTDIVEVVGRHVELKKAGINHKGLCPFHGEKTPSFIVSASRQSYHCFGCGAHGDALKFLMEHTGTGFVDAVHALAQQVGMSVPQDSASAEERERAGAERQRKSTLCDVLVRAMEHYRRQLRASARAIAYLKGRGLTGEVAARFGLGYAPEGWRGLAGVFPRYDDPLLVDSGLVIVQGDDGAEQKRYDRFRDRVMFPIRSVQGEVIGFGGRVLDAGEPKYLNSPETPVFVKGRELYGLYEARQAIRERSYVLVVEGYMDVVALAQLGFGNAVATLGTACTAEHVAKLFRFTDQVVFSFDGDAAGRRAAARALEAALPHASDTRSVRFVFLPPQHDPDSFVREHGTPAFERCVAEAVPLSRQLIEHAREGCDLGTAEGRARLLAAARPLWSALPDGALARQVLADLAETARLDLAELRRLWGVGATAARDTTPSRPARRAARTPRRIDRGTATLLDRALWLLVQRSELWGTLDGSAHDLLVSRADPYGAVFARIERHVNEQGPVSALVLLAELRDGTPSEAAGALVARIEALHAPADDIDLANEMAIVLGRLRLQAIDEELELLSESGMLASDDQSRGRTLMQERAQLKSRLSGGSP